MRTENTLQKTKTSIYLYNDLREKMAKLIPAGKQTELINDSIRATLEAIEKQKAKKIFLAELHSIKPVKRKETALQTLTKLRKTREKQLLNNLKSK